MILLYATYLLELEDLGDDQGSWPTLCPPSLDN